MAGTRQQKPSRYRLLTCTTTSLICRPRSSFGPDVLPLWVVEMDYLTAPAMLEGALACVENEGFSYPLFS